MILNFILVSSLCAFLRVFIRDLILDSNKSNNSNFINIAIYGAGYKEFNSQCLWDMQKNIN